MVIHVRDAVLRPGRGQAVRAPRSRAESDAGCMVGSALVLRAAAGMATTGAGTGLRRRSRSADGCDRSSRHSQKQEPADEQETEYSRRLGGCWQGAYAG